MLPSLNIALWGVWKIVKYVNDEILLPEDSREENFGAVADCIDGAVFHDDSLVSGEESLERSDDASKVGLVFVVVVQPLGIQNVVECAHTRVVLILDTRSDTTKLLETYQINVADHFLKLKWLADVFRCESNNLLDRGFSL